MRDFDVYTLVNIQHLLILYKIEEMSYKRMQDYPACDNSVNERNVIEHVHRDDLTQMRDNSTMISKNHINKAYIPGDSPKHIKSSHEKPVVVQHTIVADRPKSSTIKETFKFNVPWLSILLSLGMVCLIMMVITLKLKVL
jgi:hypothetical protein